MGITIAEFKMAMEILGAKRLPDQKGLKYYSNVPCFAVDGIEFIHSGLSYVIQGHNKVPKEIMNRAMVELEEETSGGDIFDNGEIYSVKGILTLVSMLQNRYSRQLIDELANTTYQKLLGCPMIQSPGKSVSSNVIQELSKVLAQYDSIVNPFAKGYFKLKDPSDFLDRINLSIDDEDEDASTIRCVLNDKHFKKVRVGYRSGPDGWSYSSWVCTQEKGDTIEIMVNHTYDRESQPAYEKVYFYRTVNSRIVECLLDGSGYESLDINLTFGMVENEESQPVTDEQIQRMISMIEISIQEAQQEIICHMIDD